MNFRIGDKVRWTHNSWAEDPVFRTGTIKDIYRKDLFKDGPFHYQYLIAPDDKEFDEICDNNRDLFPIDFPNDILKGLL